MTDPLSSNPPSPPGSPTVAPAAPGGAAASTPQPSTSAPSNAAPARPPWATDTQWTNNTIALDKVGEELNSLRAFKSEQDVRRNTLPKSDADYAVSLPASFQLPAGVNFEFDKNSPELAQARKVALARGMDQETFSDMLGVYAASKISEQARAAQARDVNLQQLGAAGPQRVEAVATWLTAKAGEDGKAVGNFIRQYPSAPIVKAMESLIKQFSSQGGADFSQSHRDQAEEQGKIPGYENMSFVQRRIAQMTQAQQRRPNGPAGGGR